MWLSNDSVALVCGTKLNDKTTLLVIRAIVCRCGEYGLSSVRQCFPVFGRRAAVSSALSRSLAEEFRLFIVFVELFFFVSYTGQ